MSRKTTTATGLSAWCCTAHRRGDAREESDYDVAVFLRDMPDRIAELYRLADLSTKIIVEEDGPSIHLMAYPAGFYNDPRMPLMYAIRVAGIDL